MARRAATIAGLVLSWVVASGMAGAANAGETAAPAPTPTPISCSDRYPANGPAGLDLQLGCTVGRLTGLYLGGGRETPPLTTYLAPLAAVLGGLLLIALLVRVVRRRAGRRLAVAPTSWWSCPKCRSVNRDGASRCYACGTPWSPAATSLAVPAPPPDD
jgi:hypothetical protein